MATFVFGACACLFPTQGEDAIAASGVERRVPWRSSKMLGTPEPPLPYSVERSFTNIVWKSPLYLERAPEGGRLILIEQGGGANKPSRILSFSDDPSAKETRVLLEVPDRLVYSLAFDPQYQSNGHVYVFSNGRTSQRARSNRIARYTVSKTPTPHYDPNSEYPILEWPSSGHDGGALAFGLDGMLYITTGDGSSDSDRFDSGQSLDDLLGAVLRIDLSTPGADKAYGVPADNPFRNLPGVRPEIWAYGLRNPWRMCVDAKTGHIWVGNNGQDLWETAHLVRRGENYGWSVYEGAHPFYLNRRMGPTPLTKPTIEHLHSDFRSLTGGVVYYGDLWPDLDGHYIYGDYTTGRIWAAKHDGESLLEHRELADTRLQIAAFAVDRRGELLIVDHAGGLYRLVRAPKAVDAPPFPKRLSQTGLFVSVKDHELVAAVIPYEINTSGWHDGAQVERWMAIPGEERVVYNGGQGWNFPDGAALIQTLSLDGDEGAAFRVETRILLRQQGEWGAYSYRWKEDQSDAILTPRAGVVAEFMVADQSSPTGTRAQDWRFPSRADCMGCHSRAANFVLGVSGIQLNRQRHALNQLTRLSLFGADSDFFQG